MKKRMFTKSLAVIISILMLLTSVPVFSVSADTTADGLEYSISSGKATITGYTGDAIELDIPSSIDSYPVTSIVDYYAFSGCTSLTSITIPDSVTYIGNGAFFGCTSLTSVNVDSSNAYYSSDDGVLFNKNKTELICYPAGKTNDTYAIPDSVTRIGDSAFYGCTSLTSITIPDSVTSIDYWAFSDCTSLASVTIPDSVTGIGGFAFEYCTSLTSITIPDGVISIGGWAFSGCTSLTSVNVDSSNAYYSSDDGVLFNKNKTELICYPAGKTNDTYAIPDSVTSIDKGAFENCTSLTSITIPDGVTSIGGSAFENCTSLASITIPDGVTSIGGYAFENCTSLTSITIPDSVTYIGDSAFYGCSSLTSVTIPDSVTYIDYYAFSGCTSLTSVTIPDSVTSIDNCAFSDCTSLTSITIPDSVTYIGDGAFFGCTSLTSVNVDSSNAYYSSDDGVLFNKNKTELICYPAGKTNDTYAIPDGVTSIDYGAFFGCTSLTSVTISEGVESIGGAIFSFCSNLKSIDIPASVTLLDGTFNFSSLEAINVHKSNSVYTSFDGVLFDKDMTTLIAYPPSKTDTEYHIPEGVTTINQLEAPIFNTIFVPESVTEIINFTTYGKSVTIYGIKGSYAETFALKKEIQFVALTELTDSDTNITVITGTDAQLKVETITDTNTIDNVNLILTDEDVTALYDITFTKDGTEIQPEGAVTVKIPTGNENAKVYRVEDDGTLTDMNATYIDGFMVFTTDHFSLYALAVKEDFVLPDIILLGDVNLDNDINIKDATAIQKYVAGLIELSDEALSVADFSGDANINVKDATAIQKKIAGLI